MFLTSREIPFKVVFVCVFLCLKDFCSPMVAFIEGFHCIAVNSPESEDKDCSQQ